MNVDFTEQAEQIVTKVRSDMTERHEAVELVAQALRDASNGSTEGTRPPITSTIRTRQIG